MFKNTGTNATAGGEFQEANPGAGLARSILGAAWLNMIQRELQNLVTGAGLVLDVANFSQVLAAIKTFGFSTGDGKITLKAVADFGWVMANDGTIGNAASGASTRANADTAALYTLLWTNIPNAAAPVTGGRGPSAAADFAAGKPIALTKQLGRAIGVAGAGAGLTERALGTTFGEQVHALTASENAAHEHLLFGENDGSDIPIGADSFVSRVKTSGTNSEYILINGNAPTSGRSKTSGEGAPHNNMQPTTFWNVQIKL